MTKICKNLVTILALLLVLTLPIFATYRLIPGDTVDIRVVGHEELNTKQQIAPDGTISIPLLGRIEVQNKALSELDITLSNGFSKYLKSPQVTTFFTPNPVTAKTDSKIEPVPFYVVLHDLKKDQWDVKTAKTLAEGYAWTAGRSFELLRDGVKIENLQPEPGDSLILGYSKEPDFWENNWYKVLTAVGVVTGVYLSLSR